MNNNVFSNIIIVSDFDGTLRGDDGKIPERNKAAIERFKKKGGTFIIASGRAEFVLDEIDPSVSNLVNGPCILSNGSYLFDYKSRIRMNEKCLDSKCVREMLYLIRDIVPEAAIRIVRGDEYHTPDENEEIKRQIANGFMANVKIFTYETIPVDKINKITVCAFEDEISKIRKTLEANYSGLYDFYLSWKTALEIQAKNVSKGNLLDVVRDKYKKNDKNIKIYAVGDYENDIDMMKKADFACCPSNSLDVVKEFCTIHLCSNNEGAIADLIGRLEN